MSVFSVLSQFFRQSNFAMTHNLAKKLYLKTAFRFCFDAATYHSTSLHLMCSSSIDRVSMLFIKSLYFFILFFPKLNVMSSWKAHLQNADDG